MKVLSPERFLRISKINRMRGLTTRFFRSRGRQNRRRRKTTVCRAPGRKPRHAVTGTVVLSMALLQESSAVARPAAIGSLYSRFNRILDRLRAGQTMTGRGPRNSTSRHSPSAGEWKPLMTVTPALRHCCARSCICKYAYSANISVSVASTSLCVDLLIWPSFRTRRDLSIVRI